MVELSPGQVLPLVGEDGAPLTRLRMALGWDHERNAGFIASGKPEIDLDAAAVQFAGGRLFDLAFFNNLRTRDGSVEHLGDNRTGRGDGDDETLTVDLTRVHGPVDAIVFVVTSYQGHELEWVANASCRLVDDTTGTELARFTLTHGPRETGVVMAVLQRNGGGGDGWSLRAVGQGVAITRPTEHLDRLAPFLT